MGPPRIFAGSSPPSYLRQGTTPRCNLLHLLQRCNTSDVVQYTASAHLEFTDNDSLRKIDAFFGRSNRTAPSSVSGKEDLHLLLQQETKTMAALLSNQAAALLLLLCYIGPSAAVLFSSLPQTLRVTASPSPGQVLHAGVDEITVTWAVNQSLTAGTDSGYKKVKVTLCYAPVSQTDRGWRKTDDHLKKDKTCQFKMATRPYAANGTVTYTVERSIPTATFFVRAYALDASDTEVAYGQSTDPKKTTNLFDIVGITGRHASLDIAAACFSAFSVVALAFFFVVEKRKAKK
ncbi:high affinity nitrate transporter [Musa troglodytarum]|uniref:High affinity nitrate transporter n=1 Tax=Musa troglodytarum TaxID=320322 RepID=A0A9E7GER7_9LILI|nr:high affinity nitrate transporter [Musa troglodytarum]